MIAESDTLEFIACLPQENNPSEKEHTWRIKAIPGKINSRPDAIYELLELQLWSRFPIV
jgi:hypothetical protein